MKTNLNIPAGLFAGGEIEPGQFHASGGITLPPDAVRLDGHPNPGTDEDSRSDDVRQGGSA